MASVDLVLSTYFEQWGKSHFRSWTAEPRNGPDWTPRIEFSYQNQSGQAGHELTLEAVLHGGRPVINVSLKNPEVVPSRAR